MTTHPEPDQFPYVPPVKLGIDGLPVRDPRRPIPGVVFSAYAPPADEFGSHTIPYLRAESQFMRDILTGWPDAITKHQDRLEQEGITQLEACSPLNLQATSVLRLPNLPFHHKYGRQAGLVFGLPKANLAIKDNEGKTLHFNRGQDAPEGMEGTALVVFLPDDWRAYRRLPYHATPWMSQFMRVTYRSPVKETGKVVEQLNEQDHAARQSVVQNRQLATLVKGVLTLQNEHAKPPSALANPLDQPLHEPESREEFLANIRLNNFHPVPHPPIETTYAHTELVKEEPNEAGGVDRGGETVERNGEGVTKDAQAQEMEMQDGEAANAEEDEVWRRETEEWSAHRRLLGGPGHLQQIHEERVRLAGMQPGWRDELATKGYITLPPLPQGHPFLNSPASANDPRVRPLLLMGAKPYLSENTLGLELGNSGPWRYEAAEEADTMTIGPVARPNEVRAATEEKMEEKQARPDEIRTDGCGEGMGEQPNSQVVLWIENQTRARFQDRLQGSWADTVRALLSGNTVLRTVRQQQADFASFINGVLARQAEHTSIAAPDADEHDPVQEPGSDLVGPLTSPNASMRVEVSPPAALPIKYLSEAEIDELDEDDEPWTNDEDERRFPHGRVYTAGGMESWTVVQEGVGLPDGSASTAGGAEPGSVAQHLGERALSDVYTTEGNTQNSAQSLMMVASHEGDYSRSEVLGYPDFGDDDPMEGQMDWSHTNGREDSPNSDTEEKKSAESHGDSEDSDYQDSGSDQGQEEEGLYYYHPRYQFRRTAIRKERELGHSPMKGLTQSFPTLTYRPPRPLSAPSGVVRVPKSRNLRKTATWPILGTQHAMSVTDRARFDQVLDLPVHLWTKAEGAMMRSVGNALTRAALTQKGFGEFEELEGDKNGVASGAAQV